VWFYCVFLTVYAYIHEVIETLLNLAHSSGLGDLDGGFDVRWEQFWIKGCGVYCVFLNIYAYIHDVIERLNLAHISGLRDLDGGFDVSWEQF